MEFKTRKYYKAKWILNSTASRKRITAHKVKSVQSVENTFTAVKNNLMTIHSDKK